MNKMTIDHHDDTWCLEYLRFTPAEMKEIAFVLQIPSLFRRQSAVASRQTLVLRDLHTRLVSRTAAQDTCVLWSSKPRCIAPASWLLAPTP